MQKGTDQKQFDFFSVLVPEINVLICKFIMLPQLIDWR